MMTRQEVISLMEQSTTETAWNANCEIVKSAFGGKYPDYWWQAVIAAGILARCQLFWLANGTMRY